MVGTLNMVPAEATCNIMPKAVPRGPLLGPGHTIGSL